MGLRRIASTHLPAWLKKWLVNISAGVFDIYAQKSYSQEGEDMILQRIFEDKAQGFYVDVGAHHPTCLSNTYHFYRRGWHGINVDALPGTKKLFQRMRPRDITIECGVGQQEGTLKYFAFNVPALNTFSEQEAIKKNSPPYHIIGTFQIPMVTLKHILDDHLPAGMQIDFMSIDAEGFDHEIVMSNDWTRYRPRVLLVELLNTDLQNSGANPTVQLLNRHNYRMIAKSLNTYFFAANEALLQHA